MLDYMANCPGIEKLEPENVKIDDGLSTGRLKRRICERDMPTYVYETIPANPNTEPRRFELFQRMTDDPLVTDPQSGEPVRRIITGGIGIKLKGLKRSTVVNKNSAAATACGCATGRPHKTKRKRHGRGCGHNH